MRKIFFITLIIFSFFALISQISWAEYFLDDKNLTIDTQTNNDKADIIRLQSILYINDLYDGPITGYYGKLTESAINRFKVSNSLNPDGVVDNAVLKLLQSKYASCPLSSFLEKGDQTPIKEIKFLQYFMRLIPDIYPEKLVTGYFGIKTENAVKRLQTKFLGVESNGKINIATGQKFCKFFNSFDSDDVDIKSFSSTSSIFQTLCLAFPKQAKTGESVLFISQILGGNSPYSYSWNDQKNNEKTFKATFSKAGTYTANLKVIDKVGKISYSNCSVTVSGDTLTSTLDTNVFSFEDTQEKTDNTLDVPTDVITQNSTSTTKKAVTSIEPKVFYKPMEKYINNPVELDSEVLPVEVVKGDPIKINIINIPQDIREILISQWKIKTGYKLKAYWAGGDIINQSLDRIVLNAEWYRHLADGKVPVTKKQFGVFNCKSGIYAPKTMGWFELPLNKELSYGGNDLGDGVYYSKGYNPKDDWAIYQKGLYANYTESFYKNNKSVKREIANYFSFDRSGDYSVRFNIYFTNPADNKEYLIAYANVPLKVVDKPDEANYVKVYITPGASIDPPQCIEGYTNTVPEWTEYPYRDLDGKFLGYNWQHLFVNDDDNGGGLWNYLNLTNIFAPSGSKANLITGQEGLFKDVARLFSLGELGSSFYRAFQADPEGLNYVNKRQPEYEDKYMCTTWYNFQTKISPGMGGITGGGFRLGNIYYENPDKIAGAQKCRGICFQSTKLPDAKNPVAIKKNNSFYPDLIIKDYKMENIDLKNGRFTIKYLIKNIGGADFKNDNYGSKVEVSCKKGTPGGVDINIWHVPSKKFYKVNYGVTLTKDIKAGEEIWVSGNLNNREYCPAGELITGCVIDPLDIVEEPNEKNNRFSEMRIDCEMPTTTTTTLKTTVTSKQTSKGIMYNLLTNPGQINYCSSDSDCTIKNGTAYCTHRLDSAPSTPNITGSNAYFDKTCKCVSKKCQAI